jgi:hypothetical protein
MYKHIRKKERTRERYIIIENNRRRSMKKLRIRREAEDRLPTGAVLLSPSLSIYPNPSLLVITMMLILPFSSLSLSLSF